MFLALLFLSCEELELDPDNPFEASQGEQIPEIINYDYHIDGNSFSVNWEGNKYALEFSYMLESQNYNIPYPYLDWSVWINDKAIIIDYLDEGFYTFFLKSRIGSQEDDQGININFEINNISSCSVRMYPLYQEVKPETNFPIFIYIEECPDLMLLNMILDYNQDEIDFIQIDNSHLADYGSDIFQTSSVNEGTLNINSALLNGKSINNYNSTGNFELIRIDFYSKSNFSYINKLRYS